MPFSICFKTLRHNCNQLNSPRVFQFWIYWDCCLLIVFIVEFFFLRLGPFAECKMSFKNPRTNNPLRGSVLPFRTKYWKYKNQAAKRKQHFHSCRGSERRCALTGYKFVLKPLGKSDITVSLRSICSARKQKSPTYPACRVLRAQPGPCFSARRQSITALISRQL